MSTLKCANCDDFLFHDPMQCPCGDRLCGPCYNTIQASNVKFECPLCHLEMQIEECFRDRAVTMELKKAIIKCKSPSCLWEGRIDDHKDHVNNCEFMVIPCPNKKFGCNVQLPRSKMDAHESECSNVPTKCEHCEGKVKDITLHLKDCAMVPELCRNGCGSKVPKNNMEKHILTVCTHQMRECTYKEDGCQFMGDFMNLADHYGEKCAYHNQLMKQSFKESLQLKEDKIKFLTQQNSAFKSELKQMNTMILNMKQDLIGIKNVESNLNVESTIQNMKDGFSEMALMIQTLQITSYNGVFIWKIPEVQRRRHEAKIGKTVSLYSAPFYTGRHGYKACLRLYMDGDGGGKGTHLSFFLTIMRGEYDALLQWPFKQTVNMMLLDQDKAKNIVQSFKPEPTSSSFQRPRHEMNVASGCPMFAPLSILNNSSYVKDDTMFLKCRIDNPALTVNQSVE